MRLTKRQDEILIGMILGDACLEKNGDHVRVRAEHGMKQKNYIDWKYHEFEKLATDRPRIVRNYHSKVKKVYKSWHFSTYSNQIFDKYWRMFYPKGRKIIPSAIVQLLKSPLSLAIWSMDDGCKRNDCNAFRLSTDNFTKAEQEKLGKCLKENFRIQSRLHRKGTTWNIYIPQSEIKNFCRIIAPYIIPSLKYKIILTRND